MPRMDSSFQKPHMGQFKRKSRRPFLPPLGGQTWIQVMIWFASFLGLCNRKQYVSRNKITPEGFSSAAGYLFCNESRFPVSRWCSIPLVAGRALIMWGLGCRGCMRSKENRGRRRKDPWVDWAWGRTLSGRVGGIRETEREKKPL